MIVSILAWEYGIFSDDIFITILLATIFSLVSCFTELLYMELLYIERGVYLTERATSS